MPLDYPQRRQNLVYGGKSGFIGYLMIRPPGPWRMYWKTLEGLVLWMDFNQCQAIDLSGHGNNGTIYGAQCVQGRSGEALSFDGVDDYVEVLDSASLNITDEITIVVWFNTFAFTDPYYQGLVKRGTWENGFLIAVDVDPPHPVLLWFRKNDSGLGISFGATEVGEWYQVVAVLRADGTAEGWLNGSLEKTVTKRALGSISAPLYIGSFEIARFHNGLIDEVRIYNRALSEEEIKWLYEHT